MIQINELIQFSLLDLLHKRAAYEKKTDTHSTFTLLVFFNVQIYILLVNIKIYFYMETIHKSNAFLQFLFPNILFLGSFYKNFRKINHEKWVY